MSDKTEKELDEAIEEARKRLIATGCRAWECTAHPEHAEVEALLNERAARFWR